MNKKLTNNEQIQVQDSFDNDDFPDLEYVVPNNENFVYNPNVIKQLKLDLNSDFELVEQSLDSGQTVILPKDKVDRKILNFEDYRTTIVCFYVIYNTVDDKYYVGQTSNLGRRIFDHIRNLDRGTHDNDGLQKDFDNIKSKESSPYKYFKVYTVQNTPVSRTYTKEESYALDLKLREIEAILIKVYRDANYDLYNSTGFVKGRVKQLKTEEKSEEEFFSISKELEERGLTDCSLSPSSTAVPVIIDGKEYGSVTQAAKEINANRRTVFKRILSKRFPNYMTKEQVQTGKLYVYINKKERNLIFTNTITGEEIIFTNPSQCDDYLENLKETMDSETITKYQKAGIFVDRKTMYRQLDSRNSKVFLYCSYEDPFEKVLVDFD